LAKELAKLGHKVYVLTFNWSKRVLRTMLKEGFEVVSLPHIAVANGLHMPSFGGVVHLVKFIKKERPEIIHCQPLYSPLSLVFIGCQRLSNYRIVGSLITGEYSINSLPAKIKYYFIKIIIERYIESKVDSFFALSNDWKKILLQLFNIPYQKMSIIPLGADAELFKFDTRARTEARNLLRISSEDVVVVYSGKIIRSKDLHILVKAIAPIIRQKPKVKLLIVGKGEPSYLEYLKELCSNLKISNNVIFHSWVNKTKLPKLYSASDIAVWPGGPSISVLEAASVGLPVIIKRSPIEKYKISYDNGFVFSRGNINELRKYLGILISNVKLREEMGHKSKLLVKQKLNWRTITTKCLDEYTLALA